MIFLKKYFESFFVRALIVVCLWKLNIMCALNGCHDEVRMVLNASRWQSKCLILLMFTLYNIALLITLLSALEKLAEKIIENILQF